MVNYQPTCSVTIARQRAQLYATIRQFFASRDVLEVQTPVMSQAGNTDIFLQSVAAKVSMFDQPTTYYLHTSPEFAMKRLLASWRVPMYQICPVFRDNEIGTRHNIEFTMLEWYRPDFSLEQLNSELADLLSVLYGHSVIFDHYRYADAFMDFVNIHPFTASCETLKAIAMDNGLKLDMGDDHQGWLDVLFSHLVEPKLGYDLPTVIYDYPVATASLAKTALDKDGNWVAKRFELYINGLEIANAYDELADSEALRLRFEQDNSERNKRGLPVMPIDEYLLSACAQLPACSGIAVGLDRLLMVLVGTKEIQEVIAFPSKLA